MKAWYIFGAYTTFIVVILIGAYADVIPTEIAVVPMYDSVGHFVLYGIWFYLLHHALARKDVVVMWMSVPLAFLILFPLVALEEFAQMFASTRTFSHIDLLWGFLGMIVFWFLSKKLNR